VSDSVKGFFSMG